MQERNVSHFTAVLDNNPLWALVNELFDLRTKWKWIGLGLGIPEAEIDAMKGSDEASMLSKWLKGVDPLPTCDALVTVLRSRAVKEEKKAKELEAKFCTVSPLTSTPTTVYISILVALSFSLACSHITLSVKDQ